MGRQRAVVAEYEADVQSFCGDDWHAIADNSHLIFTVLYLGTLFRFFQRRLRNPQVITVQPKRAGEHKEAQRGRSKKIQMFKARTTHVYLS